jgi:hypothetical protein
VQLNRAEVEGLGSGAVYVAPSYDGRTLAASQSMVTISSVDEFKVLGTLIDAKNFNLIVEGTFDLSTIILEAMPTSQL